MNEQPRTLADRLGPAQVSSEVRARIVAGTFNRLQRPAPGRRWLFTSLGLGAALASAALALPWRRPAPVRAIVTERTRAPVITPVPPVAAPVPPVAATAPRPRALIGPRTDELGRHRMILGSGGRAVWFPGPPGDVAVRLDQGRAQFEVAHLDRAESFRVLADPVEVTVVGTRFRVERQGTCSAVLLQEGRVDVSFRGQVVAHLRASDERTFCLTASGLESSSPGETEVRGALALIAQDRDLPRAAELLERYGRAHPGGVLEAEALFHLVRLHARLGNGPRAAEALGQLELRHPGDERLPGLHALVEGK